MLPWFKCVAVGKLYSSALAAYAAFTVTKSPLLHLA